jgi:hypothetical protein
MIIPMTTKQANEEITSKSQCDIFLFIQMTSIDEPEVMTNHKMTAPVRLAHVRLLENTVDAAIILTRTARTKALIRLLTKFQNI